MHVNRQRVIERIGSVAAIALDNVAGMLVLFALEPNLVNTLAIIIGLPQSDRHAIAREAEGHAREVGSVIVDTGGFGTLQGAVSRREEEHIGVDR